MTERVNSKKFLEILGKTTFGRLVNPPQNTGLVLWIYDPLTHVPTSVVCPSPYDMTASEYGVFCREVMRLLEVAREKGRELDRATAASEEGESSARTYP